MLRHGAAGHQLQRPVQHLLCRTGFENDSRDLGNVGRQRAAPRGILGDELQQRGTREVVAAFERDMLVCKIRMLLQLSAQALDIAGVQQIDGAAKRGIFNALVMRQVETVG